MDWLEELDRPYKAPTVEPREGDWGFRFWPETLRAEGFKRWMASGFGPELPDPYKLQAEDKAWKDAMYLQYDLYQFVNKKNPLFGLFGGSLSEEVKGRLKQSQELTDAEEI